jgi:hypothetical protein
MSIPTIRILKARHPGLVPKKVTVTNSKGKTFQKVVWVKPTEKVKDESRQGEKLLSESRFYSRYMRHTDIRGRIEGKETGDVKSVLERNKKNILKNGFRTSYGNVLSSRQSDSVMGKKYNVRKGDYVYLVPRGSYNERKSMISQGWKPKPYEVVIVEYDEQPLYDLYKKAFQEYMEGKR